MKCPRCAALPFAFLAASAAILAPLRVLGQQGGSHSGMGGGAAHATEPHATGAAIVPAPRAPIRPAQPPVAPATPRGVITPQTPGVATTPTVAPILPSRYHPRRPVPPVYSPPFYGVPSFGFGAPFFGLGFGGTLGPGCYSYWNWGDACSLQPYYSSGGLGYYSPPAEPIPPQLYVPPMVYEAPPESNPDLAVLYLKDGTAYEVADYWLTDGKMHFTTVSIYTGKQTEHTIDIDDLDLQKSVDTNTERGFTFVLRTTPIEEYLKNEESPSLNPEPPQPAPQDEPQPDETPSTPTAPQE